MKWALLIGLMLLAGWSRAAIAVDQVQERRIRIGLKLFRAVLAADEDIVGKADSSGKLVLLVMYAENRELAEEFAKELSQLGAKDKHGTIRDLPIQVQISNEQSFKSLRQQQAPAGIYVVEELGEEDLKRLVQYGIEHHVIIYSPFEGDVNKGVLGGLAIETRVRPYINLHTMRESKIRIKEFFLKVAKHFEP